MRCFVAIDIKKELLCLIEKIQKELREVEGRFSFSLPETTHITLRFLGEMDKKTLREVTIQLREVVKKHRPFELNTTNVGVFQRNGIIHTIWLGVELKTELQTLVKDILNINPEDVCGFTTFTPHITIARVKYVNDYRELNKTIFGMDRIQTKSIQVNEIKIKKSTLTQQGPIYEDVESFKLSGEFA
ncbi:MAG: RNA 2',3'-cyclic phosphodiesterase [Candidatus Aenigmarchaeota archaeon]|nr:RNA 2',3'-cyclic phosphodiesterase [Candidatus Aenigmarchaeota archaeon]